MTTITVAHPLGFTGSFGPFIFVNPGIEDPGRHIHIIDMLIIGLLSASTDAASKLYGT
jgi:hypothetical protein